MADMMFKTSDGDAVIGVALIKSNGSRQVITQMDDLLRALDPVLGAATSASNYDAGYRAGLEAEQRSRATKYPQLVPAALQRRLQEYVALRRSAKVPKGFAKWLAKLDEYRGIETKSIENAITAMRSRALSRRASRSY
jgi:hypothetical protein